MTPGRVRGATREIGKSQGYVGLAIRDEAMHCPVNGPGTPVMVTAWVPTPAELAALNAGAPVEVRILGRLHPPILLGVGDVPDDLGLEGA